MKYDILFQNKKPLGMLLLILLTGCTEGKSEGTVVGNPPQQVQVELLANSQAISEGKKSASLTVSEAWMVFDDIQLRPEEDCSGGAEAQLEGPVVANAIEQGIVTQDSILELENNRFCRLEVNLASLELDEILGIPVELEEHSILVEGVLEDGTPFQILSEFEDSIRIEPVDGGTLVVAQDTSCLTIVPDLHSWINEIALNNLAGNGMIYVNKDENEEILEYFEDGIKDGIELLESASDCMAGDVIGQN